MLRLATSAVGPVSVATGTSTSQTVEAYNAGDGTLAPQLSVSGAAWLTATVGAARPCVTVAASNCLPLQFALNTSALAAGSYTGTVTVTAPNTVDAPQTITVTVQVGGDLPSSVNAYAAPGYTNDISFTASVPVAMQATTKDGGAWLSVSVSGGGSFNFDYASQAGTAQALALNAAGTFAYNYPYRIRLQPPAGMALGTYTGTVTATSAFAPDNTSVPVTMHLVNQPIIQAGIAQLQIRLAQGAPDYTASIPLSNLGPATLTIQNADVGGAQWITSTANSASTVALTINPGSLAAGTYNTTVTIASNAANGNIAVPVSLQVVPQGAPLIYYQGVLDNATYIPGDTVTPGDVMIVKGEQLSFSSNHLDNSSTVPLPTQLGGASVLVNGETAPLYYASSFYSQLAFQMPVDIASGTALVQVERDGTIGNTVSVNVASRAPKILPAAIAGNFGIITFPDYVTWALPVGAYPGVTSRPATAGDVLTIWCIGLGATSPSVASGVGSPSAEPLARLVDTPQVNIGGVLVTPAYAGLTPGAVGLYQVNVEVPAGLPTGIVPMLLEFPGSNSNSVNIPIQ